MIAATLASSGSSFAEPAKAAVDKLGNSLKTAMHEADLMQSNITNYLDSAGAYGIHELERQARAMRSAYLLHIFKSLFWTVDGWLTRRSQNALESYLASSQNLADLESRMRRYGDQPSLFNAMTPHLD